MSVIYLMREYNIFEKTGIIPGQYLMLMNNMKTNPKSRF